MAKKLTILAAILSTLLIATHATTTYIKTGVENPRVQARCRRQLSGQEEKLDHCAQYIKGMDQGIDPLLAGSIEETCRSGSNDRMLQCCIRECCSALRMMDEDCACEVMEDLVQEMMRKRMVRQLRDMSPMMRAKELMHKCRIQGCDMGWRFASLGN